ncbi:hypothetical protein [uncultured Mesotoga sp.]|uniref:hypothetical protein n=1 Tax=uncultured Mesotoga sp. TaxID=1184400 RepID=UPI0002CB80E9|nr:hypothetical protein [uncultured Mesotoga sp.]CCU84138.1 exported hypothetical protein [Mesotoga infera]
MDRLRTRTVIFALLILCGISSFAGAFEFDASNSTIISEFEFKRGWVNGKELKNSLSLKSMTGVDFDEQFKLYKCIENIDQKFIINLDFALFNDSSELYLLKNEGFQIQILGYTHTWIRYRVSISPNLFLSPEGYLWPRLLLGDDYQVEVSENESIEKFKVIVSMRLVGRNENLDICLVFEN